MPSNMWSLQLIIKKSEIEKTKKKQECASKLSKTEKIYQPKEKNGYSFTPTKKKHLHLLHQDAQATEAIGDGTASIVLKGDARCFHPLIDADRSR